MWGSESPLKGSISRSLLSESKATPEPLTCAQIALIGETALKKHTAPPSDGIRSKRFSKLVALHLLEEVDAQRLLFTQSDLERLQAVAVTAWPNVLKNADCSSFTAWIKKETEPARARLFSRLKKLKVKKSTLSREDAVVPEYSSFAPSEQELDARLKEVTAYWVQSAHPKLVQLFGGQWDRFVWHTGSLIYQDAPLEMSDLLAKAMLKSVDRFSTYFSPDEFEDFFDDLSGGTAGIGIKVHKVPQGLMIEEIVHHSPAGREKNLAEGDVILSVDGKSIVNMTTDEAKKLLKGESGSSVKLEILRPASKHELRYPLTLVREVFDFTDAKVSYRLAKTASDATVGVITIPSFYGPAGPVGPDSTAQSVSKDVADALKKLTIGKNPQAIVLDLRDNPGGYLEEAISIGGLFLGQKAVVGVKEKGSRRVLKDDFATVLYSGPLVVLVNEESASAAEVLAGALKDHNRALLVGSPTTYGKGTVQKFFPIEEVSVLKPLQNDSGVLKITTSIFYSPLGHTPDQGGVKTHIPLFPIEAKKSKSIAQDVAPFLPAKELEKMNSEQKRLAQVVDSVSDRSHERFRDAEDASGSGDARSKRILAEAIEIAADYSTASLRVATRQN